jgi:hypothetical protein
MYIKPFRGSRENLYAFGIEINYFVLFWEIITRMAELKALC